MQAIPFYLTHPVHVISAAKTNLVVVGADAFADLVRLAEIERRAFYRSQISRRDELTADRRDLVGVDRQLMIEHIPRSRAGEVEIGMVRQIDERILIRRGLVFDFQFIGIGERIADFGGSDFRGSHSSPSLLRSK